MSIIRRAQLETPLSASYANTSSYAETASFALNGASGTSINTGSFVTTSSFAAFTASYNTGSFTGSFTGTLIGTSSWAVSASQAISSSYAFTASYVNPLQQNVIITGSIYIPDNTHGIYFSGSGAASRLLWNDTDGTLDLGLKGGNVTLQIGQESVIQVINKTGANLLESEYKAVRVRRVDEGGAQGQRLAVVLAQADNDANSVDTLGIVTEDIAVNQEGFITNNGLVRNINTTGTLQGETWTDGDVIYLSPTVPGKVTKVKPQAPEHTIVMGYVVYAHQNQGKIFVKVDNGYEIDELHNVRITTASLSSGDLLVRSSSVWINSKQLTGSYHITGSLQATSFVGALIGTSSWAVSASRAVSSSYAISASQAAKAASIDTLNQNVTIIGNLSVFGTASYTYVTASQLDVGTEWISVNVAEPGERFGGLKVYDSGSLSHQATASLAWDSLHNHWVYQNASGSGYSGGMLISGPRNTGSLGDEPELNRWFVTRGDGGDHINSTQIFSSGSTHQITGSLTITNNLTVSNSIDSQNHYLKDSSGYFSVEWNGRILRDFAQLPSIDWGNRILYDSSNDTSIDWENRTLTAANNSGVKWDDYVFYPADDDAVDLGISPTNRFRRAYFARDVFADGAFIGNLTGTASFTATASLAVSSSVTTVKRGGTYPSYLTMVAGFEPQPRHEQLLAYQSVFISSSFGTERLHANSMVAPSGFTGSLEGTASWASNASTASYISPTFISASAAASGFGAGGGTSAPGTNLGLVYAVSLGYLMP